MYMVAGLRHKIYYLPLVICLGLAILQGIAYLSVVTEAHSYEAASRWIFQHVAKGSRILNVHWDDTLPIHLPGLAPRDFDYHYHTEEWELPLYEPDTEAKLQGIAHKLSRGDILVFPTQRIPGSIPRISNEYPLTTAFLQLLYAGKLGYRLELTAKTYPGIGPLLWNDDTADESLSVYDHPKVTVFRNIERLSPEQIVARVHVPAQWQPLPTRTDILTMQGPTTLGNYASSHSPASMALQWIFALGAIAFLGVLLVPTLPQEPAYTAAVGVASLMASSFLAWFLIRIGAISPSQTGGWLVVLILAICAAATFWRRGNDTAWIKRFAGVGGSFLMLLAFFLIIRSFQPEIYWGEKPMDSAFLHYFARGASLPPEDPWAAGRPLGYYYFGSFLFGWLANVAGVTPAIAYNFSVATVHAMLGLVVWTLLNSVTKRGWFALLLTFAVVLGSNLEWIRLVFVEGKELNFDTFWATSRLLRSPAISEYPGWSFLFADLHAHFIALPFVACLITLLVPVLDPAHRFSFRAALAVGLVWGGLFAINTWDFLAGIGIVLAFCLTRLIIAPPAVGKTTLLHIAVIAGAALATAVLLVTSFAADLPPSTEIHWGFVRANEFNQLTPVLRHFGVWLVLTLIAFCLAASRGLLMRRNSLLTIGAALPPLLLEIASSISGSSDLPWTIVLLCILLAWMGAVWIFAPDVTPNQRAGGVLVSLSAYAITFSELVYLMDRMNTIFKVYNVAWMLIGIGSALVLLEEIKYLKNMRTARWIVGGATAVLAPCLIGGILNIYIMTTFRRVDGPRPTLDGQQYLLRTAPDEKNLIDWMNKNIQGTPTVLEAIGSSYGPFSRIVMHTGLPTVVGWEHHLSQRGTPHKVSRARAEDVRAIYTGVDIAKVRDLLLKYDIAFIVVSTLERETYGSVGLGKFDQHSEVFRKVVSFGQANLYAVLMRNPELTRSSKFFDF